MSDQYEKTKPHKEKMDDDFECRFIVDDKAYLTMKQGHTSFSSLTIG